MKILITGTEGQLGSHLLHQLKNYEPTGIDIKNLDITKSKSVEAFFREKHFDCIIHPAAYTNVDAAESDILNAYKVNALGTQNLVTETEKMGAKFVYISTDYVFNGEGQRPYLEYDKIDPQTVYGASKLAGEEIVKSLTNHFYILRVAWLYGLKGNNFVKTIMKTGKEKGHLDVVNDQYGTPTFAKDVAEVIEKLIQTDSYGIYHATNEGQCTWYDFAKKIVEFADIKAEVMPTITDKFPRPAKRPKYSVLENMMLKCHDIYMRDWETALKEYIEELLKISN